MLKDRRVQKSLSLPLSLMERIERMAKERDMSFSSFVSEAMQAYTAERNNG